MWWYERKITTRGWDNFVIISTLMRWYDHDNEKILFVKMKIQDADRLAPSIYHYSSLIGMRRKIDVTLIYSAGSNINNAFSTVAARTVTRSSLTSSSSHTTINSDYTLSFVLTLSINIVYHHHHDDLFDSDRDDSTSSSLCLVRLRFNTSFFILGEHGTLSWPLVITNYSNSKAGAGNNNATSSGIHNTFVIHNIRQRMGLFAGLGTSIICCMHYHLSGSLCWRMPSWMMMED